MASYSRKYNIGDMAMVIGNHHIISHKFNYGDLVKVAFFDSEDNSYNCIKEGDSMDQWISADDLILVERASLGIPKPFSVPNDSKWFGSIGDGEDMDDMRGTSERLSFMGRHPESSGPFYGSSLSSKLTSKKGKFMRNLSELSTQLRRTFNPEQKALWRAGYIDNCGKWTEKAHVEAMNLACDANKEKLVEFANEEIELAKEESK